VVIESFIHPSTLPSQRTNRIAQFVYPVSQPVIKLPTTHKSVSKAVKQYA